MVDEETDDAMVAKAAALTAGIEAALPGWVERSVLSRIGPADPAVEESASEAGRRASVEVGGRVRALLAADIDDQATTPLTLLREAVRYPTEVLLDAGVPPVPRDDFSRERFPDDVYDLSPASFADVDPALGHLGIAWGAAKAWAHMRRHRADSEATQ